MPSRFLYQNDFHKSLKTFRDVRESYRHFIIFNNIPKKLKCSSALFLHKMFNTITILKKNR